MANFIKSGHTVGYKCSSNSASIKPVKVVYRKRVPNRALGKSLTFIKLDESPEAAD